MRKKANHKSRESECSDVEIVSQNTCPKVQVVKESKPPIDKIDYWLRLNQSECFKKTNNMIVWYGQLFDFIQNSDSVLFIFGPSGSGKRKLVSKILSHSNISYEKIQQKQIFCQYDRSTRYLPLSESILQCLEQIHSKNMIRICYSFPLASQSNHIRSFLEFKSKFFESIAKCSIKLIFVLNSQIYNSFYILNQNSSIGSNSSIPQRFKVIKMKIFDKKDMKDTLEYIVRHQKIQELYYLFEKDGRRNNQILEEILQLSEGDLRKALNLVYLRLIQKQTLVRLKEQKKQKKPYSSELKNYFYKSNQLQSQYSQLAQYKSQPARYEIEKIKKPKVQQRIAVFHGIGKFLHGKRLDIQKYYAGKFSKRYYNEEQLKTLDPPFYFNPIQLYRNIHMELPLFVSILQQNYIQRFKSIRDIKNINHLYCMYDSLFTLKNGYEDEAVEQIKQQLITWGILIYNRNSRHGQSKGIQQIKKSQNTNLDKNIKQKKRLLKTYFDQQNLSETIQFAHMIRKRLHSDLLVRTLFNKSYLPQTSFNDQEIQPELDQECINSDIEKKLIAMQLEKIEKANNVLDIFQNFNDDVQIDLS